MPELPDVEIFRRYLNATALHQEIKTVRVHHDRVLKGVSKAWTLTPFAQQFPEGEGRSNRR